MAESLLALASDMLARSMAQAARGRDFRRLVYGDFMQPMVGQSPGQIRASAEEAIHPGVTRIVIIYDGQLPDGTDVAICDAWDMSTGESLAIAQPYKKTMFGAWKSRGGVVRLAEAPEPLIAPPTPAAFGLAAKDGDDDSGAEITAVAAGSAAELAGLVVSDVITLLGEQRISCYGDLVWGSKQLKGESTAVVAYWRDGERCESVITFQWAG